MFLSKTCIYGIRAVLYTATQNDKKFIPISTISTNLGISFHFLTKILQILTQKGIMNSYRGPHGGVALALPAESVKLLDIVKAIDGTDQFTECLLGLPGCGTLKPCPLHDEWCGIRGQIHDMLNDTTVAELAKKITKNGLRLSDIDQILPNTLM